MTVPEQPITQADPAVEEVHQTPPPTEIRPEREPVLERVGRYKIIGTRQLRLYREDQFTEDKSKLPGFDEAMYFTDFKFLADFGEGEKPYVVRTTGNCRQYAKNGVVEVYNFHLRLGGDALALTNAAVAFIFNPKGSFTLSATFVSEDLPDSRGREHKWEMN